MNCLKLSKRNHYFTVFSLLHGNNVNYHVSHSKLKPLWVPILGKEVTKTGAFPTLSCHIGGHRATTQESISATPECKSNWCNIII